MSMYKCPGCACMFCSPQDLIAHLKVFHGKSSHAKEFIDLHKSIEKDDDYYEGLTSQQSTDDNGWIKSKYGDGKFIKSVSKDPKLALAITHNGGSLTIGGKFHKLSGNKQWIVMCESNKPLS